MPGCNQSKRVLILEILANVGRSRSGIFRTGVMPASTIRSSSLWMENPGTLNCWGASVPIKIRAHRLHVIAFGESCSCCRCDATRLSRSRFGLERRLRWAFSQPSTTSFGHVFQFRQCANKFHRCKAIKETPREPSSAQSRLRRIYRHFYGSCQ